MLKLLISIMRRVWANSRWTRRKLPPVMRAAVAMASEWDARVRQWFPELADIRLRRVAWPAVEAHHDYIAEQLAAGVTVATIHQRLRDERGRSAWPACGGMWRRTCRGDVPVAGQGAAAVAG